MQAVYFDAKQFYRDLENYDCFVGIGSPWEREENRINAAGSLSDPECFCIGAAATVHYRDGSVVNVLLRFRQYKNARAYLESALAKGSVLRIDMEDGYYGSIPLRDVELVEWLYLYGPRDLLPNFYCCDKRQDNLYCSEHGDMVKEEMERAQRHLGPNFSYIL